MGRRKYTDEQLEQFTCVWAAEIEAVCKRAAPDVVAAGLGWYDVARAEARLLADAHNVSLARAAAVIAVCSPLTRWAQNLEDAWAAFGDERMRHTLPRNQAKAWRLAQDGEPISHVLSGKKVRSFAMNIWGYTQTTTNDTWVGRALGIGEKDLFSTVGVYEAVTDAFRIVAGILGWTPAQTQAVFWLQTKFEHGLTSTEREQYALPDPF